MKTIFSLVTKPINQNVSIIRISGPETFILLKDKFKPSISEKGNTAEYRKFFDEKGNYIDETIVLGFKSPNSFTGEDVIEIQSHGSMFVVKKILKLLRDLGISEATPGEFSKQAFINNKLDLSQAEAINSLINAETETLANIASQNINSKQSKNIDTIVSKLSEILSRVQVSIDYPENRDLPKYSNNELFKLLDEVKIIIKKDLINSKNLIKIDKGIIMSIIGVPNAGKSTLMNSLLNEERAIVTDVEGTTRDIIESTFILSGVKVTIQDTAGIRSSDNEIEKIGIEKAIVNANKADIVLFLLDGTKDLESQREIVNKNIRKDFIEVVNKSDLKKTNSRIVISAKNNNIENLLNFLEEYISTKFDYKNITNSTLISQNQIDLYEKILFKIETILNLINKNETTDILLIELEDLIKRVGRVKGLEIDEEYITNLFSSFCLGK